MRIIKPAVQEVVFHHPEQFESLERFIEWVGRKCYKSEEKMAPGTDEKFVARLLKNNHGAMLEHVIATAHLITDRGVSHELVRHRIASFAQESTRYCNYAKGKFGNEITVVEPPFSNNGSMAIWIEAMQAVEDAYLSILQKGTRAELARGVLPNSLKTEIIVTANLREWLHIFELRCARAAHPSMRRIMCEVLKVFAERIPSLYSDLNNQFNGGGSSVEDSHPVSLDDLRV